MSIVLVGSTWELHCVCHNMSIQTYELKKCLDFAQLALFALWPSH